jgi:hypothetical protein
MGTRSREGGSVAAANSFNSVLPLPPPQTGGFLLR